jgi:uncharacterized protein (DUF2225 family)
MWGLKDDCEDDSAGRMRVNKSTKNDDHCSTYVQRKNNVRVCENLFRRTALKLEIIRKKNKEIDGHDAFASAGPKTYSDCM